MKWLFAQHDLWDRGDTVFACSEPCAKEFAEKFLPLSAAAAAAAAATTSNDATSTSAGLKCGGCENMCAKDQFSASQLKKKGKRKCNVCTGEGETAAATPQKPAQEPAAEKVVDRSCNVCSKPASKQCSKCQQAKYCSADCQRAHWKTHKTECGKN